jgi:RHS repeat-associated protein
MKKEIPISWKPLEERVGSATAAARQYLWGERPGHRDELVMRDRDTDGNGTLDERLYATMDYFNGTAVLNTSGAVLERYAYSAFGVRRVMAADFNPRTSSDYAWDFGFQGQFRDSATGWSNYGYRFYVPELGRWINRDPIGERGGVNVYAFVGNNGLRRIDLLGLKTCNGGTITVTQGKNNNPVKIQLQKMQLADKNGNNFQAAPFDVDVVFNKPDCGCCEVRQDVRFSPLANRPHQFRDKAKYPDLKYHEDFDIGSNNQPDYYGHRSGSHDSAGEGYKTKDSLGEYPDPAEGCHYSHHDSPTSTGIGTYYYRIRIVVSDDPEKKCQNAGATVETETFEVNW